MNTALLALLPLFAAPQQDPRMQRVLERIEKELEAYRTRLVEEVRKIVREEMDRAKGAKPPQRRVLLGIALEDLTDADRKSLAGAEGVKVGRVEGPAEKAGIKSGDLLLTIGGTTADEEKLGELLGRYSPGDEVELVVLRGGARLKLKVTLVERKD